MPNEEEERKPYTTPTTKRLELVGLAIVKRFLMLKEPQSTVQDVHSVREYFPSGIDLIWNRPHERITIDLKTDSYIGSTAQKTRGLCNPDSGAILIEVTSQLHYDRRLADKDEPGWFFTSQADYIYYYFIALLNRPKELTPFFKEYRQLEKSGEDTQILEERLIRTLDVDKDLLITYSLNEARQWYEREPEDVFLQWVGAANPEYVTVSRRVDRERFVKEGPGNLIGAIYDRVIDSLGFVDPNAL